jgi:hypothetical protein
VSAFITTFALIQRLPRFASLDNVHMSANSSTQVTIARTSDGDYRWELVQRHSLFRRKKLEVSDLHFLTAEGAYAEGLKALRFWHDMPRAADERVIPGHLDHDLL